MGVRPACGADLLAGGGSIYFRAIGAVSLKNVSRRVELFQVMPTEG